MAAKAETAQEGAALAPGASNDKVSRTGILIPILILTCIAIAGGGLFGLQMNAMLDKGGQSSSSSSAVAVAEHGKGRFPEGVALKALPPIITNLASPERAWVRLEVSLVVNDEKEATVLAASVTEDFIAFLRTVALAQIQGATGFQLLREDLIDRARTRSGGKVRDVVIHTMIIE